MNSLIIKNVKEVEKSLKGRLPQVYEMLQKEADYLHEIKNVDNDEVVRWKLNNLPHMLRGFARISRECGELYGYIPRGAKYAEVIRKATGERLDLGLISVNVVTSAFVNKLTDSLQDSTADPLDVFNWHGSGTGTNAEAAGDTALQTEVDSRVQDATPTEGASANIYHTEAQLSYTTSRSVTEHGVFSASTAGTLMDRSVFSAISADTNTDILFKYELTSNSGG